MVIFHSYVKLPEGINHDWWFQMAGNGGLMVILLGYFPGDLMVIKPLVMECEWLIGGLEPWNLMTFNINREYSNPNWL